MYRVCINCESFSNKGLPWWTFTLIHSARNVCWGKMKGENADLKINRLKPAWCYRQLHIIISVLSLSGPFVHMNNLVCTACFHLIDCYDKRCLLLAPRNQSLFLEFPEDEDHLQERREYNKIQQLIDYILQHACPKIIKCTAYTTFSKDCCRYGL